MAMALAVANGAAILQPLPIHVNAEHTPAAAQREVLDALRSGDATAWERLLLRMERRALALAWRILNDAHLAADAVQDAYVKAYVRRAALHSGSEVERWLLAIVANTARDVARQKTRMLGVLRDNIDDVMEHPASSPAFLEEGELEQRLCRALARIDEEARVIFLLVHQEGFTYESVAKEFGLPIGTVRSTLHRTRLRLRELLGGGEGDR